MSGIVRTSVIQDHILHIEIDNDNANSLSKAVKLELQLIFKSLSRDKDTRAVIISGKGENFCCGDDLNDAVENAKKKGALVKNLKAFTKLMDQLESLPMPTIAAIEGWCIGGGLELALCCDIRVASKNSNFITAGVNMGLMASATRLPKIIGLGRAKRLLLTGSKIDADQAKEYGIVTDVLPSEDLFSETIKIAETISEKAPLAIRATKKVANIAIEASSKTAKKLNLKELLKLSKTEDHLEALDAFEEKRNPDFWGR